MAGLVAVPDGDVFRAAAGGENGRFIDEVCQIGASEPRSECCDVVEFYLGIQGDFPDVDLQNIDATTFVGPIDQNLAVETSGAQQGRIEDLRPVGCRQQHHAFAFARQHLARRFLCHLRHRISDCDFMDREIQLEFGATAGHRGDEDIAARLLDDAVDGGQTKPSAFAHLLCREERLKNLRQLVGGDSGAGVDHPDQRIFPGRNRGLVAGKRLSQCAAFGFNADCPAFGHRVARVHHQIHQHLLKLSR